MIRMISYLMATTGTIGVFGYFSLAFFMPLNWWAVLLLTSSLVVVMASVSVRNLE